MKLIHVEVLRFMEYAPHFIPGRICDSCRCKEFCSEHGKIKLELVPNQIAELKSIQGEGSESTEAILPLR